MLVHFIKLFQSFEEKKAILNGYSTVGLVWICPGGLKYRAPSYDANNTFLGQYSIFLGFDLQFQETKTCLNMECQTFNNFCHIVRLVFCNKIPLQYNVTNA